MTRLGLLREGQAGQEEVALYKESRAERLGACSGEVSGRSRDSPGVEH